MEQATLENRLADLPLGDVHYFDRLTSTNDEAARLVSRGALDLTLVVADEQTAGRGRAGRRWYTPPGAGLAFSLVWVAPQPEEHLFPRLMALGALAVCEALQEDYRLEAEVKWPNDVLVGRRKVAGVLVEAQWTGERLDALILGIGINVAPGSVSKSMAGEKELDFPATCLEAALGQPVERLELLHAVLLRLLAWRDRLASPAFLQAWEKRLAFQDEWVAVSGDLPLPSGQVIGLAEDGSLKLRVPSGEVVTVQSGDVRLRPCEMIKKGTANRGA